jgi:transposase
MLLPQKRVLLAVRQKFVLLATEAQIEMRTWCHRYGISTKTGYQWLKRFRAGGLEALAEPFFNKSKRIRRAVPTLPGAFPCRTY